MIRFICVILSVSSIHSIQAQSEVNKDREIRVHKDYNNEIYKPQPVFDFNQIVVAPTEPNNINIDSISAVNQFNPPIDITIQPLSFRTDDQDDGYNGMVKIDRGTLNPLHAQGDYTYTRPNYYSVWASAQYDHWKSALIPDKYQSDIKGKIGFKYYITHEIQSKIDFRYTNRKYGIYGNQNKESQANNRFNQYQNIGAKLLLATFRTMPKRVNFSIVADINNWSYKEDQKENNYNVQGNIRYRPKSNISIRLTPQISYSASDTYSNNQYFKNTLSIQSDHKNSNISVGISASRFNQNWVIWPEITTTWKPSTRMNILMSSTHTVDIQGAQYLTDQNPYIDTRSLVQWINNNERVKNIRSDKSTSIKSTHTLTDALTFHAILNHHIVTGASNYATINADQLLEYTIVNYNLFSTDFGAQYELLENMVQSGLSITYNQYYNQSAPLIHKPKWLFSPFVKGQLLNNKLVLTLRGYVNSPQMLSKVGTSEVYSTWRKNFSFNTRYQILNRASLYLDIDNVLSDSYSFWNGYDNFGRNVSGGILVKF